MFNSTRYVKNENNRGNTYQQNKYLFIKVCPMLPPPRSELVVAHI